VDEFVKEDACREKRLCLELIIEEDAILVFCEDEQAIVPVARASRVTEVHDPAGSRYFPSENGYKRGKEMIDERIAGFRYARGRKLHELLRVGDEVLIPL